MPFAYYTVLSMRKDEKNTLSDYLRFRSFTNEHVKVLSLVFRLRFDSAFYQSGPLNPLHVIAELYNPKIVSTYYQSFLPPKK